MIEWAVVLVARVTVNAPVSLSLDKYFNRRATSDNTVRYRCDRDHWFKYVSVSALHLLASVEYLVRIFKFVDDRRHSRDAETEYVFILPSCPIRWKSSHVRPVLIVLISTGTIVENAVEQWRTRLAVFKIKKSRKISEAFSVGFTIQSLVHRHLYRHHEVHCRHLHRRYRHRCRLLWLLLVS